MAKYRKKPIPIDAIQWHGHGDNHPDVERFQVDYETYDCERICENCGKEMSKHGRIKTLEGWQFVCPCDWIITDMDGNKYPCKPDIFEETYEEAD